MSNILMNFYCISLLFLFTLPVRSISPVRFQEGFPPSKLEYSTEQQFLLEKTIRSRGSWPSFYKIRCFFQDSIFRKFTFWQYYSNARNWFGTWLNSRRFPYSNSLVVIALNVGTSFNNGAFVNCSVQYLNQGSIVIRNMTLQDPSINITLESADISQKNDIAVNFYDVSKNLKYRHDPRLSSNTSISITVEPTIIPAKNNTTLNIYSLSSDLKDSMGPSVVGNINDNIAVDPTAISYKIDSITNMYDLPTNPKYGVDPRGTAVPYQSDKPTEWGGISISTKELESIKILRERISKLKTEESTTWLTTCTDVELVRFLRSTHHNLESTWKSVLRHADWRIRPDGAESLLWNDTMEHHPLHREIFWMGLNKLDCPTLVIRTTAHDGLNYNYDAKVFVRFFATVMEQGKREFGLGATRQACVILDRHPVEWMAQKEEKFDLTILRSLVELFRILYDTLMNHYPDILHSAKVIPASWIFQACYSISSKVMDKSNREKFELVKFKDVHKVLSMMLTAEQIPVHFGGLNTNYGKFSSDVTRSSINANDTNKSTSDEFIINNFQSIENRVNNRKSNYITSSINEDIQNNAS